MSAVQFGLMRSRPLVVTIVAVLFLVQGAAALILAPRTLAHLCGWVEYPQPDLQLLSEMRLYRAYTLVATPIGALATLAGLAVGIGLLGLSPWSRAPAVWLLIYKIVACVLGGAVVNLACFVLPLPPTSQDAPGGFAAGMRTVACGAAVSAVAWGLVLGALLFYMTRENVKEAFEE